MSDEPENHTLAYLRRIDGKLDHVVADIRDLKERMTSAERQLGALRVDFAGMAGRLDRVDLRLERIERRIDLADA